jgi:diaminohydroxyphosphoribosylaminopyrimidine deaminase/5-amino-6-(5-phosphoribosylamino)uracil reductase
LIFTEQEGNAGTFNNATVVQCPFDDDLPERILSELHARRIQSLLVEGGAELINTFLKKQLWDEALVVRTPKILAGGIKAPLIEGRLKWRYEMAGDELIAIGR